MPQLDISLYIPQLFWLLVIFGTLYVLMARVILPKLEKTLEVREQILKDLKSRTSELEQEIENLRQQNDSKIKIEHNKALEQIAIHTQKWKEEAAQKESELQILLHKRLEDLYDHLHDQQAQTLQDLQSKEQELVSIVVEKLTGVTPTKPLTTKVARKTQNYETIH